MAFIGLPCPKKRAGMAGAAIATAYATRGGVVQDGNGFRPRPPGRGARLSAEDIRGLRSRLGMTREQFAKLLGVSPGSIFGWETGRTIPRGRSMARVLEVRKMGVRKARARVGPAGRPGRPARRRRARGARARRKKAA